jgi:hypothetical protein
MKKEALKFLYLIPQVVAAIIGWELGKWLF